MRTLVFSIVAVSVLLLGASPANSQGDSKTSVPDVLQKTLSISAKGSVYDLVLQLAQTYHTPVSFISAGDEKTLTIVEQNATLKTILDQVSSQTGAYRVESRAGRVILMPNDPKYRRVAHNIHISDQPRLAAAGAYVEALNQQLPEAFGDLIVMPEFGDPRSQTFTDIVSVSKDGIVLDQLVELLGSDPKMTFLIVPAKSGVPMLAFNKVRE